MINVASPYPSWLVGILKFLNQGGWILLSIAAVGGSIFAGIRLRRRWIAFRKNQPLLDEEGGPQDPMLQSVPGLGSTIDTDYISVQTQNNRAVRESAPSLVWAGKEAPLEGLKEIALEMNEILLGSDAELAQISLPYPGISPLHARLSKSERGSVTIADMGSETGTWVNYAPVSKTGILLHNGDLVQIGRLTFRYKIGSIKQV
ncbi:MAG: FHA domain-containing protein [Anaerolineae bacterium]|nr:FHA domain-containing protein [Anaerolineae bacterium]